MSQPPANVPSGDAVASGASSQPPPQSQVTSHVTHSQPVVASEAAKHIRADHQKLKATSNSTFSQLSTPSEEILKRFGKGTTAWATAREIVLKGMITTQPMPLQQSATKGSRGSRGSRGRGRGGSRGGKPPLSNAPVNGETNRMPVVTPMVTPQSTPISARGSSKGRGSSRGRVRGGGRPSKRKRSGSEESEGSDISASYTPLATTTKSGRSVQKPTQFSPPKPSSPPTGTKRKRGGRRVLESSVCKTCRRGYSPASNMIVFCDGCNTPYHQYCHDPPISSEVIAILDKEWFCIECVKSKEPSPVKEDESQSIQVRDPSPIKPPPPPALASGEGLSYEQKSAYLTALPHSSLVSLLLSACARHPHLPIFESRAHSSDSTGNLPTPPTSQPPQDAASTTRLSSNPINPNSSTAPPQQSSAPKISSNTVSKSGLSEPHQSVPAKPGNLEDGPDTEPVAEIEDVSDGYDSDPPAHFPKPGNGLKLRSDIDELEWLIDDNFEVFSHIYKVDDGAGSREGERVEAYALTAR